MGTYDWEEYSIDYREEEKEVVIECNDGTTLAVPRWIFERIGDKVRGEYVGESEKAYCVNVTMWVPKSKCSKVKK